MEKKMRTKYLFLLVFLMGCDLSDNQPKVKNSSFLVMYEDKEHGVICYRIASASLSCVKVK